MEKQTKKQKIIALNSYTIYSYKEYDAIGKDGEEKSIMTYAETKVVGDEKEYNDYCKSFEAKLLFYQKNGLIKGGCQMFLSEDPDDETKHINNQKCLVHKLYDRKEKVWKKRVEMVKLVGANC